MKKYEKPDLELVMFEKESILTVESILEEKPEGTIDGGEGSELFPGM